jgi:hypothetical protein
LLPAMLGILPPPAQPPADELVRLRVRSGGLSK